VSRIPCPPVVRSATIRWLPVARIAVSLIGLAVVAPVVGARDAASYLPETTKACVSAEEFPELLRAWNATQLGRLFQDPAMKAFLDDVAHQVRDNLTDTRTRLALDWESLQGLAVGEVCLAAMEPAGEDTRAVILILEVREGPAIQQVLGKVDRAFAARRAARHDHVVAGVRAVRYDVPSDGPKEGYQAFYAMHHGRLIAADHPVAFQGVVERMLDASRPSLAGTDAYKAIANGTMLQDGRIAPHVRWFVEPFGTARILRASAGIERKRGTDLLKSLRNQGFEAVRAAGGQVAFHVEGHEILHRTMVYAPGEKRLAARMLDFPNGAALEPEPWVPANVANYISFRWNMRNAFESVHSLVDELAGEPFFEEFLDNLENDPNGPRVNVRRDVIGHLGGRVTFVSDCTHPITPRSERFLVAIELTDPEIVAGTVAKALQADPTARREEVRGVAVWEIVNEIDEEDLVLTVEFQSPGLGFGAPKEEETKEQPPALPNSAVAVVDGKLLISSHADYLKEVVAGPAQSRLAGMSDYIRVNDALEQLGAGNECSRLFSRSDETYHATYELVRSGRMGESESLLGRLLRLSKSESGADRRKPAVDGSKLPEFEQVRRYLGPAGMFTETHETGWTITGSLLPYEARSSQ